MAPPAVSESVRDALGGAAPDMVSLVALVRSHREPMVRHDAARLLGAVGDHGAVAALEDALFDHATFERSDDDVPVSRGAQEALEALYRRLGARPEDVARTVLLWASVPVHHGIVLTLQSLGAAAGDGLQRLFRHVDAAHRESAAFLLGQAAYAPAAETLRAGLRDPEARVRVACAHALGVLADPAALPGLIELLTAGAPRADTLVLGALRRCCPPDRRFEVALAYAAHWWNAPDRKRLFAEVAALYDGRPWRVGEELWAHLLARHGPLLDASALAIDEGARRVARGQVFWVVAARDGFGSGSVDFTPAAVGEALVRRAHGGAWRAPFAFTDATLDVLPWLEALGSNAWERAGDVPGLP